jgi:hypothetical protein
MAESGNLTAFLGGVRRRYITTQLLRQGVVAATAGLAGLILLLLLGTQVMDWAWPAVLFAGAFGWGCWRFLRALPSAYRLAQMTDQRLGLADALSTAFYFQAETGPIVEAQRRRADELAGQLAPDVAVPMVWPKAVYAAAVLALVAVSLLGLRYGMLHTLDLRAPVSEAIVDVFRPADQKKLAAKRQTSPWMEEQLKQLGLTPDEDAKDEQRKFDGVQQGEITTPQIPDVNDLSEAASSQQAKGGQEGTSTNPGEEKGGEGNQAGKEGEKGETDPNGEGGKPGGQPPQQKGQQGKEGKAGQQPGESSSMLDKMKDAFQNMMNKLKMPNQDSGQQQASNKQGAAEKGAGNQQQKGGEKGQKQDGQKGEGQENGESPGDQAGEEGEKSANAKGQGADSNSNQKAPPDAKSGVGKADGDKAIKDAEQQQAMGKISELFGKRAQNITGEVMVEVSGGKQQLRTQYTKSGAAHAEGGGEIRRDEVPLHHQDYVQQYFEEVRKAAAPVVKKQ